MIQKKNKNVLAHSHHSTWLLTPDLDTSDPAVNVLSGYVLHTVAQRAKCSVKRVLGTDRSTPHHLHMCAWNSLYLEGGCFSCCGCCIFQMRLHWWEWWGKEGTCLRLKCFDLDVKILRGWVIGNEWKYIFSCKICYFYSPSNMQKLLVSLRSRAHALGPHSLTRRPYNGTQQANQACNHAKNRVNRANYRAFCWMLISGRCPEAAAR